MLRFTLILLTLHISITNVFGQSVTTNPVEDINNSTLLKVFAITNDNNTMLKADIDVSIPDGYTMLYFDSEHNCRKLIKQVSYPESRVLIIAYYNELGNLISILFNEEQPEGYSYNITASTTGTDYFSGIKYNYRIKYDLYPDVSDSRINGIANSYPETIGEWNMTTYLNINNLFSSLNILPLVIPKDCKHVTFSTPMVGDVTYINANNIALQDRIGNVYQTLDVFDVGVYVKLDEYAGDSWCRVSYGNKTGYIRSEYLGVVCQTNKSISETQSKQHMSMETNKLNEKWTASYKTDDTESQKTGAIEIEFRPDGTFRYDERHPGESVSYANGTYYYREQTGEIFVHVESGGYAWITRPATKTTPPLYWGEVYSNYQLYLKITKRSDATVTVIEHIFNQGVSNTAIWEENNGNYSLTTTDQSMMKERQYTVDSLAESDYFR